MSTIPQSVKAYLKKFSDKHWVIEADNLEKINNVVVVPSIAEHDGIVKLISSLEQNNPEYFFDTLILFVVNNTTSAADDVKENNKQSLQYLRDKIKNSTNSNKLRIGLIDASTSGNELDLKHGGVGLARKTGMDTCLSIFDYSSNKKKILICLDADCTVSNNYLQEIIRSFNENNISAASINFKHNVDEDSETTAAISCYEIFLRYYVLSLKLADSPYAFETIGSAMACDYESYIKIGGMNKLKAAEDFYFLEKLSKVTTISTIKEAVVYPSARRSWRVPFGTGQRVGRFLDDIKNEYLLYDPESFYVLRQWLKVFNEHSLSTIQYLEKAEEISKALAGFLRLQDFINALNNIRTNTKNIEQFARQKNIWFDGFRTLKLIHYLRDNGFPQVKMFDALDELFNYFKVSQPERNKADDIPDVDIQKKYLHLLIKLESEII